MKASSINCSFVAVTSKILQVFNKHESQLNLYNVVLIDFYV